MFGFFLSVKVFYGSLLFKSQFSDLWSVAESPLHVPWDSLYFLFKWYCTFTLNKIYDGMTCQGTALISSAFSLFQGSWRHLRDVGFDDLRWLYSYLTKPPLSECLVAGQDLKVGFGCLTQHMWSWEEAKPLSLWARWGMDSWKRFQLVPWPCLRPLG